MSTPLQDPDYLYHIKLLKEDLDQGLMVHPDVFTPFRPTGCGYRSCKNECCRHGAWIEEYKLEMVNHALETMGLREYVDLEHAPELARPLQLKLTEDTEDGRRYDLYAKSGKCIFMSSKGDGVQGCAIHKWALANGQSAIAWKPSGCSMFPLALRRHADGSLHLKLRHWKLPCQKESVPQDSWSYWDATLETSFLMFGPRIFGWMKAHVERKRESLGLKVPADPNLVQVQRSKRLRELDSRAEIIE